MTRTIEPIVSTEWLESNLGQENLTVIDIRWEEEYAAGHIPGALSVPFGLNSDWAVSEDLILELPPDEQLFETIGRCGLNSESRVVIAGRIEEPPAPPYAVADAVRVAVTLIYAGIRNAAVLAGGHPKWEREGRPLSTATPGVVPTTYRATTDRSWWVDTRYVEERLGKAVLIDGRDPEYYFGVSTDPLAEMNGHIPTARNLPIIWVWEQDYTYRPLSLIHDMAVGVIGEDREQEVITYCGAGGYASAWWFLLTQLLGYRDVKIYDGSMEAWVEEQKPVVRFSWTQ
jgi:thiosulfate/3-mercaptopyruvate sulfurtransferase